MQGNNHKPALTKHFIIIFLSALVASGYSLYSQYYHKLELCPLCIVQRTAYIAIFVIAILALLTSTRGAIARAYGILISIGSIFGAAVAGRQIYLQSLPKDQLPPSCGIPLDILYQNFPITMFLKKIFLEASHCDQINWRILGIPGAQISLIGFIFILFMGLLIVFHRSPKIKNPYNS